MNFIASINYGNKKYSIGESDFYISDINGTITSKYPLLRVFGAGAFESGEYDNFTFYFPDSDKIVFTREPKLTQFIESFKNQILILEQTNDKS